MLGEFRRTVPLQAMSGTAFSASDHELRISDVPQKVRLGCLVRADGF
jgi:hypothetical protein